MHVEVSVALNYVTSYLYSKLPRRRVELFREELERAVKSKFEGHWYPDKPSKGSGYRCVRVGGGDPVVGEAAARAGMELPELLACLPDDLTLWIDPSEVSYQIGERGAVKVLYSDHREEDQQDTMDKEVQDASTGRTTFNPEAQTFTPESAGLEASDFLQLSQDISALCGDQSFQPIDSLSSSLSGMSLSPSSHSSPAPGSVWSTSTSPSSSLFASASLASPSGCGGNGGGIPRVGVSSNRQTFTAASFAQTKFGSTKLKTQGKRPNRLSPTEFGNYFRQAQRAPNNNYAGPQRPRSLSPRDPRIEFLMDQQQRMMFQQQQQQQQHQMQQQQQMMGQHMSPYGLGFPPMPPQNLQQLSPSNVYPDMMRRNSSGFNSPVSPSSFNSLNISPHMSPHLSPQMSPHVSPHLSPNMSQHASPQSNGQTLFDLLQNNNNNNNNNISYVPGQKSPASRPTSLGHLGRQSGMPGMSGAMSSPGSRAPGGQNGGLSPENQKSFTDGVGLSSVGYTNLQHLLMAN